jgi:hypothetical protein
LKRTSTVCWENPWFRNNISRYLTWIVTKEIATIKQYKYLIVNSIHRGNTPGRNHM